MKKLLSALLILAAAASFANDVAKYKDSADKGNPQAQLALGILDINMPNDSDDHSICNVK